MKPKTAAQSTAEPKAKVQEKPVASTSKPKPLPSSASSKNGKSSTPATKVEKPIASIFAKPAPRQAEKMEEEEEYRASPVKDDEEGEEELDDEAEEEQEGEAAVKL